MKIAIFTDSFRQGLGGLTKSVINFSISLAKKGDEVVVFTMSQKKIVLDVPIKIIYLRSLPIFNPTRFRAKSRLPIGFIKAKKELAIFKPDIIHNHSIFCMGWLAVFLSRQLKIPLVHTCHVYLIGFIVNIPFSQILAKPITKIIKIYTKNLFNNCQCLLTPSRAMKKELLGYGIKVPIHVLSNGIDFSAYQQSRQYLSEKLVKIIYVGRLSFEKNILIIIKALKVVIDAGYNAKLFIIGSGEAKNIINKEIQKNKLEKNVILVGSLGCDDLKKYYNDSDVFISASHMETQGLVFLEAAASGLPLIGVDSMAAPEIIINNYNGYCITVGDYREMAKYLIQLIVSPETRKNFGDNSKIIAKNHDFSFVVDELRQVYYSLIK